MRRGGEKDAGERELAELAALADGSLPADRRAALEARIRERIREDCSPRHVPNEIVAIREIPRTLSGKVLELPVKKILQGADPAKAASRDSLANPKALDFFVEYAGRD